jgi:hypothetical protein
MQNTLDQVVATHTRRVPADKEIVPSGLTALEVSTQAGAQAEGCG